MLWVDVHDEVSWVAGHDEVLLVDGHDEMLWVWVEGFDEVLCYLHLLILIDATILTRVSWRRPQSVKPTTSRYVCACVCVYSVSRVLLVCTCDHHLTV